LCDVSGTVAIENEWRLSVLDVDFDRNQIQYLEPPSRAYQLEHNDCLKQPVAGWT